MRRIALCGVCSLLLVWGCGSGTDKHKASRPKTVAAGGHVTYMGKPLAEALIVFSPVATDGVAAMARSDEEGAFQLMAYPPDPGAVPGQYRVAISMPGQAPPPPTTLENHDAPPPKVKKGTTLIPEKYSNGDTSGIDMAIQDSGSPDMKIDLK